MRLGYMPRMPPQVRLPGPLWVHVPRCVPRAGFLVQAPDRVQFTPWLPLHERERVLEEHGR